MPRSSEICLPATCGWGIALRQKLRRARLQFADLLIAEIARGLNDPTAEKIEDELVALGLIDVVRGLLPEGWTEKPGQS